MKLLYLLRHAKSSWADERLPDHDRPLAPRGKRDARRMGDWMREHNVAPSLVLCSPAVRAVSTLERLGKVVHDGTPPRIEEDLYGATAAALIDRLRRVPEPTPSVLVVGHNPGLHELANTLAVRGAKLARLRAKLPTCGLVALALPVDSWDDVQEATAELASFVTPKDLK